MLCGWFSNHYFKKYSWWYPLCSVVHFRTKSFLGVGGDFLKKNTHTHKLILISFLLMWLSTPPPRINSLDSTTLWKKRTFFFYIIFSRLCGVGVFSQSHAGSPIMNINSLRIYIFLLLSFHPSWLHFLFHLDVSLQLHHNILISTTFNLFSCTFFTAQVFFPYITAGLTTVFFYHKIPQSFCSTLSTHHSLYV